MLRTMVSTGEDSGLVPKGLWESRAAFQVLDLKQFRDTLDRYRRENAAALQRKYLPLPKVASVNLTCCGFRSGCSKQLY